MSVYHPISEDLIPDTIARKTDIPAQPDWNAAEGEPGHVLNRTHWVEVQKTELFRYEGSKGKDGQRMMVELLEDGKKYVVSFDGVEHAVTAYAATYYDNQGIALGNEAITWNDTGSGEPFFIQVDRNPASDGSFRVWFLSADEANHTFIVYDVLSETYHPLPPSLGGMPTLAEDGSDAGKTVKANAEGTGYELVKENGGSSIPVVSKGALTREQMIEFAKEMKRCCYREGEEMLISTGYECATDTRNVVSDPCDPCSGTTQEDWYYLSALVGYSTVWTIEITGDEYNEIHDVWDALTAITE